MIAASLNAIREALPSGVSLVAVSKFHPVERLMEAYNAGQRIFGENRPQELFAKVPLMPPDVQWHFIGHLQTNKLKLVLPYVTMVQSIDSLHLLEAVNRWCLDNGKVVDVLLELHLGAEQTKHGLTEPEILGILAAAPMEGVLFERIRTMELPGFDQLSIGMSNDWPLAVKHGATMVRVGTDIFGPREY